MGSSLGGSNAQSGGIWLAAGRSAGYTGKQGCRVARRVHGAMADAELIAEAKKRQLDLTPSSGVELEALAKEVVAQPRDVVERMKGLLGN